MIAKPLTSSREAVLRRWRRMGAGRRFLLALAALAVAFAGWQAYAWWTGWRPRVVLSGGLERLTLSYSPDGRSLATSGPGNVTIWDVATGEARAVWRRPRDDWNYDGGFSRDGRTFVVASTIRGSGKPLHFDVIDVPTGKARGTASGSATGFYDLVFPPEGTTALALLVDARGDTRLLEIDLSRGQALAERPVNSPPPYTRAVLSADGRYLAQNVAEASPPGSSVLIHDLETGRDLAVLDDPRAPAAAASLAFSPDGQTLAIGRDGGSVELWDLMRREVVRTFPGPLPTYSVILLAFSDDGSTLVASGRYMGGGVSTDRVRLEWARWSKSDYDPPIDTFVFDVATGRLLGRLKEPEGRPRLSPDGRSLATFDFGGATKIRDVPR